MLYTIIWWLQAMRMHLKVINSVKQKHQLNEITQWWSLVPYITSVSLQVLLSHFNMSHTFESLLFCTIRCLWAKWQKKINNGGVFHSYIWVNSFHRFTYFHAHTNVHNDVVCDIECNVLDFSSPMFSYFEPIGTCKSILFYLHVEPFARIHSNNNNNNSHVHFYIIRPSTLFCCFNNAGD